MSSGKNNRIPNTAMRIPTVRNICRQNGLIRCRIVALMMALSNDSDTSRTASTSSKKRAFEAAVRVSDGEGHRGE